MLPHQATSGHLAALTRGQVQSLLLAHTRHSLEAGGTLRETYDLEAMERTVRDRYVRGKPKLLETALPRILFLEDRSGFQHKLLSEKMEQEQLSNSAQHQIETEVRLLPDLCRLLDIVQTARDFLLETGGTPSKDLAAFLGKLRLRQGSGQHSGGPLRGLTLAHLDHLIDFLWCIRAKRMIKNRQNVF